MLSELSRLSATSNNKTTISANYPIVAKIKLFFWKLFDSDKITWYKYSDGWICNVIDKSVYNDMTFDEKATLWPVKPITTK